VGKSNQENLEGMEVVGISLGDRGRWRREDFGCHYSLAMERSAEMGTTRGALHGRPMVDGTHLPVLDGSMSLPHPHAATARRTTWCC
jgi:hypothetical protein